VRIGLGGQKPEGEWASLNEIIGKGDGKRTVWETPFPAKEARGIHVMRNLNILPALNLNRVTDPDGALLRDEDDGYKLSTTSPEAPVSITFDKPVPLGHFVGISALGRKPENGQALKILPMTDPIQKQLDEKVPTEFRKRKRDTNVMLDPVQVMYREAYNRLVVDAHGFSDENGDPHVWNDIVKRAILDTLGCVYLGSFAMDRATVLQQERATGRASELLD
jgi:hypothetical protein